MSAAVTTHPRLHELVERRKLRKQVERAVSRLIAVLDDLDGDPEAEPSLASPEQAEVLPWTYDPRQVPGRDQRRWARGTTDEREGGDIQDVPHGEEPDEPWLGAAERHPALLLPDHHHTQDEWSRSGNKDRELVNEDGDVLDQGEVNATSPESVS